MKVKISKIRFNPSDTWSGKDFRHADFLRAIEKMEFPVKISNYHFHKNEDGTLTPLMRFHEWQLKIAQKFGQKTFILD